MMSANLSRFPVTSDDIVESMAASVVSHKRGSLDNNMGGPLTKRPPIGSTPSTETNSASDTPPLSKLPLGSTGQLHFNLSPPGSRGGSTRASINTLDVDSRRSSVSRRATDAVKDLRKGVRNVTDTTKKATHKVKDKTADMGAQMKGVTKGASKWVANHTSKTAKAAMDQARSGLSIGEKFTLFASEKISVLSRKGFTHVFMFLILIGYTALGALLFMAFEAPHEEEVKVSISKQRDVLTHALWNKKSANIEAFRNEVKSLLVPFEEEVKKALVYGVSPDPEDRVWTFWKAMFFCSTITTTIGYGHITPKTTPGRALSIVYAIIGIPIFLILMADFGKLFTRLLRHLFIFIRRVYRSGTCVRARKHPTIQKISRRASSSFGSLKSKLFQRKFYAAEAEEDPEVPAIPAAPISPAVPSSPTLEPRGGGGFVLTAMSSPVADVDEILSDDNFDLPISLALFILLLYIIMGCFMYIRWEPWTFFEAFYFIFISMTTIGFGDFVPEHPAYMMLTALYLIVGLALTAMCINIIQEKLSNTFREASAKLKERFSKIMETTGDSQDENGGPVISGPVIQESLQENYDVSNS